MYGLKSIFVVYVCCVSRISFEFLALQKILGDKTSQIEELRRREHEKDDENMCLQNSLRDMGKRLQETEMKLQQERIVREKCFYSLSQLLLSVLGIQNSDGTKRK